MQAEVLVATCKLNSNHDAEYWVSSRRRRSIGPTGLREALPSPSWHWPKLFWLIVYWSS